MTMSALRELPSQVASWVHSKYISHKVMRVRMAFWGVDLNSKLLLLSNYVTLEKRSNLLSCEVEIKT